MPVLYNDRVGFVRRRHANANTNCHPDNNTNADTHCHSKTYSYAPAAPNSSTSSNPLKRRRVIRRSVRVRTASLLCQVMACLIRAKGAFENLKI